MPGPSSVAARLAPVALLLAATWLVFGQVTGFGFTNWDDPVYVEENALLQRAGREELARAFEPGSIPNEALYVPLTYASWLLDRRLAGGLDPGRLHATNLALHVAAVLFVYALGLALVGRRWPACLGALLFAVHPLQAEAVAWVMGRKDVLAGALSLAALLLHLAGAGVLPRSGPAGRLPRALALVGALLLGTAAMLAKPSALVLPALAVVLERALAARRRAERGAHPPAWRATLLRAAPLALAAVAVLLLNRESSARVAAEIRARTGLVLTQAHDPARLAHVPGVLAGWVERLALVTRPSLVYEDPGRLRLGARELLALALALGLLAATALALRRDPWGAGTALAFAWLAFLPALSVVLQPPDERRFVTADRFGYLALAGLGLLLAVLLARARGRAALVTRGAVLLVLGLAAARAHGQVAIWRDAETLWTGELARHPGNALAHVAHGQLLAGEGRWEEALREFQEGARCRRGYAEAWAHQGTALLFLERPEPAVSALKRALQLDPSSVDARLKLGAALAQTGAFDAARRQWERVLETVPDQPEAHLNLVLLLRRRAPAEALPHLRALVGDRASLDMLADDAAMDSLRARVGGSP